MQSRFEKSCYSKANESTGNADTGPDDQTPVVAPIHRQDLAGNRYTREASQRHQRVRRSIVPSILLGLAQLTNTYGREADEAPARKAKADSKDADSRNVSPRREPHTKGDEKAQEDCYNHKVKTSP